MEAFARSLEFSTLSGVKVKCFTADMDKAEIFKRGRELQVNFDFVWPCYFAGETLCGRCESCLRFAAAGGGR
jgi:7-cyano-7-deazaguanine synthase